MVNIVDNREATNLLRHGLATHDVEIMRRAIRGGADVNLCATRRALPFVVYALVPQFWVSGLPREFVLNMLAQSKRAFELLLRSGARLDIPYDKSNDFHDVPPTCRTVRDRITWSIDACTHDPTRTHDFSKLEIEHEWKAYREFVLQQLKQHQQ